VNVPRLPHPPSGSATGVYVGLIAEHNLHYDTDDEILDLLQNGLLKLHGSGVIAGSYTPQLLAAGTGLSVNIAAHTALIGGIPAIHTTVSPWSIPASSTSYIWEYQDGTFDDNITGSDPSTVENPAILLGTATTDGTGVTSVNNTLRTEVPVYSASTVAAETWIGEIKAWSPQPGQAVDATSGTPSASWALCDGRTVNGKTTPNLVGKFVRGSNVAGANATGGSDTHTHTQGSTGGSQANIDDHVGGAGLIGAPTGATIDVQSGTGQLVASVTHSHEISGYTHSQTNHSHTNPDTASSNNIPTYFTLVFCMKVT
jgi:hypothetical protein